MKERDFGQNVKRWVQKQGYEITKVMGATPEFVRRAYRINMTNKDYAVARVKQRASTPDYVILFVNESRFGQGSCASSYPDIVAIRKGKPYMFEVKTDLENEQLDRCIDQCLRYLIVYPFFKRISVIVPKGINGVTCLKQAIRKFNLPIKLVEPDVS